MSARNVLKLPWYEEHGNLADLWRWLDACCETPDDVAYFLEKPWKWAREWEQMRAWQKTHPGEPFENAVETETLCVCGHTDYWHGTGGRGSCEHDRDCACERFSPATPEVPA